MASVSSAEPVAHVEDLTPEWLSAALGHQITHVTSRAVGTGQMGECYQVDLGGADGVPRTVLAKLPAREPAAREFLHGSYASEVRFYQRLQQTVDVSAPQAYYAGISDDPDRRGTFTLLLEDLAPATQGDQLLGCGLEAALRAVVNIAGLHAPRWSDPSLVGLDGMSLPGHEDAELMDALFPEAIETVTKQLGPLVSLEDARTFRDCGAFGGRWSAARPERFSLVHGDYRLDNILFGLGGEQWAVDWQTLALGLPARDVAFFVSTGLSVSDRRAHERGLVEGYWQRLVELGVQDYPSEKCWEDYRFAMLQTPLIVAFGCAYSSTRTERGDRMFAAMLARGCQAIRDLDTLALLRAL